MVGLPFDVDTSTFTNKCVRLSTDANHQYLHFQIKVFSKF